MAWRYNNRIFYINGLTLQNWYRKDSNVFVQEKLTAASGILLGVRSNPTNFQHMNQGRVMVSTSTTMPPPAFTDARSWRKDWSWRHLIPPSNYFRWSSNRFQTGTESDKDKGGDLGQHEKQIPNKPHESWDTNSHDRHTTNHNHHSDNSISRHHYSSFRLSL